MGVPFFRRTLRITRVKPDVPRDVAEEVAFHLDMRTEELIEQGLTPEEARRQAEASFGDRGGIEQECREIAGPVVRRRQRSELLGSVLGDIRLAWRDLRRRPAFALTACLTLAVCIALNTAVFSVVYSVLLKPLPYPEPDRLVTLFNHYPKVGHPRALNTVPQYFEQLRAVTAFEELALHRNSTRPVGEPGAVQRVYSMAVTPSFFRVLGIEPHLGRTFAGHDEAEPAESQHVVINYGLWRELFGGVSSVIGQSLRIAGVRHTVIGVMPEGFHVPGWNARLWLPLSFSDEQKSDQGRYDPYYQMIARLRPEATIVEAKAQADAWNEVVMKQAPAGYTRLIDEAGGFDTRIVGWHQDLVRNVEPWLYLLWGGAIFVLLIGGVSLTHLLLLRSIGRLREMATRHVLGAGRVRLARQLLIESLLLASCGGGLGLLIGASSLRLLDGVYEAFEFPRLGDVSLELSSVGVILMSAVLVMGVSSTLAALAVYRRDLSGVLRAGASTPGRRSLKLRGGLAAAQVAVACVLLIGAALMSISLFKLLAIDPGFDPDRVLVGAINLPSERYVSDTDSLGFFDAALAEIQALPGVTAAAFASQVPFDGLGEQSLLFPEGGKSQYSSEDLLTPSQSAVSPDFFVLMGIPLLAGRLFDGTDSAESPPVMVISERLAKRYWNSVDQAPGRRVFRGVDPYVDAEPGEDAAWTTVVGVVADAVQNDLADPPAGGAFYLPLHQDARRFGRLLVKTETAPLDQLGGVRERLSAVDPDIVYFWATTLAESLATSLIHVRIPMQLLSVFAAVALLLAAIGIYGVLAQAVAQRAREIGIRMALGGSLNEIYRWVLRGMLAFVAAGLISGLGLALPLARLMTSLLYDVQPTDPRVFLAVGIVIGVVAMVAAAIPARRAAQINPVEVLTCE